MRTRFISDIYQITRHIRDAGDKNKFGYFHSYK